MNISLGIEYCGSAYHGWQKQSHASSVQQCVELALSKVANHTVVINCAGRTDAGVHATGQVVNFLTDSERPNKAWILGTNAHLPDDICVRWVQSQPEKFHARFSAFARRYRYVIQNTRYRTANLAGKATHIVNPLNELAMNEAAQVLVGEQDFSSFRASICQSSTPFRNVTEISVFRRQDFVVIDITANAFLHHMVRNITGALVRVGHGELDKKALKDLLEAKDRTLAPPTAKPHGLYLVDVSYPEEYNIPRLATGPFWGF